MPPRDLIPTLTEALQYGMTAIRPMLTMRKAFFKILILVSLGAAAMQGCDAAPKDLRGAAEPTRGLRVFVAGRPVPAAVRDIAIAAPMPVTSVAAAAVVEDLSPFPFVKVNLKQRTVVIEGAVAVDVHDPETPRVWLEVVACSPDSKEHEALVVTRARPSHIHAALLLVGLQPGEPGRVEWDGAKVRAISPRGPEVGVAFGIGVGTAADLGERIAPEDWITLSTTGKPPEQLRFVFSGSGFTTTKAQGMRYAADSAGTIVGLTTFGTETIAMVDVVSPDSGLQAPEFLASSKLPKRGTPVSMILTVR